jgi:hypothetical protein
MVTNFIVYRDEEYATSWISHKHAEGIASYLKGKQFNVLGAYQRYSGCFCSRCCTRYNI